MGKKIEKKNVVLDKLNVEYVDVDLIKPNNYNPNRQSEHEFELLCRSMEEDGFTTPAVVRRSDMVIVDGEHRWRAAQSIGMKRIPCVFVEMTDEQMKIATLRHNRARGEEDVQLAAAVLRDLAKMGVLEGAQDALMLDDVEMEKLLKDICDPETLYDEKFEEQFAILEGKDRSQVSKGSWGASDAVRAQEKAVKEARTEENKQSYLKDTMNIFRFNFAFYGEEAAIVRSVLAEHVAERLLKICQLEDIKE